MSGENSVLRGISGERLNSPDFIADVLKECDRYGENPYSDDELDHFVKTILEADDPLKHPSWNVDIARHCIRRMGMQILMLQADIEDSGQRM